MQQLDVSCVNPFPLLDDHQEQPFHLEGEKLAVMVRYW